MSLHVTVVPVSRAQMLALLAPVVAIVAYSCWRLARADTASAFRFVWRGFWRLVTLIYGRPGRCCMCNKPCPHRYCDECLNEW